MTKKLKQRLVKGKKYLVGPENKEMFYYQRGILDQCFINWHNQDIELISIDQENLELNGNLVRDKNGDYNISFIRFTSPKELGYANLAALYKKFANINPAKPKGKREELIERKCLENLAYADSSEFLKKLSRSKK